MDVDFIHEVVVIDHQLLKSKEQGYYIETPKTKSGIRQVPLQRNDTGISTGYEEMPKGRTICDRRQGNFPICQS